MATKHTKGVIDLTFHDIATDEDLTTLLRKSITEIQSPKVSSPSHDGTGSPTKRIKPEVITAVRLSNNLLTNMDMLCGPMIATLDTSKVHWMDISFNKINSVSIDFAQKFPHVTTIYCHANQISKLSEIKKFGAFPGLKSLSLYGNPVEEHKHYRNYVLYVCTNLTQFDSSPVTKSERKRMEVWAQTFRRKLVPQDD